MAPHEAGRLRTILTSPCMVEAVSLGQFHGWPAREGGGQQTAEPGQIHDIVAVQYLVSNGDSFGLKGMRFTSLMYEGVNLRWRILYP